MAIGKNRNLYEQVDILQSNRDENESNRDNYRFDNLAEYEYLSLKKDKAAH